MNPAKPDKTKNTVDNSQLSENAARQLSEEEKKQMELQASLEHEQGAAREKLTVQAGEIEKRK